MNHEEQFLAHLPLVERVITFVCRRHHLSPDESDEFAAVVRLKLIDDDYAVLRSFQGRSSIHTYLTVVVQRVFLDCRISAWGKWRPSAEAKRQGPTAVLLEKLTVRDGLSFGEACQVLRTNHGVDESEANLDAMIAALPPRVRRRAVAEEALEAVPGRECDAEAAVILSEASAQGARGFAALEEALAQMPAQERLIVKLRFENNLQVSEIARVLRVETKPLYRRIEVILRGLRAVLEARGVRREDVSAWFAGELPPDGAGVLWRGEETARERPSI